MSPVISGTIGVFSLTEDDLTEPPLSHSLSLVIIIILLLN